MKQIYYNLILSEEQLTFLRTKKYKIDRMECFHKLIELTAIEPNKIQISKSKNITLQTGQFIISVKQLEKLWNIDRKTVPVLLAKMESMGILTTMIIENTTVRILHPIFGWYIDGNVVTNPYFKMQSSSSKGEITNCESTAGVLQDSNDSTDQDDEEQINVAHENADISTGSISEVNLDAPELSERNITIGPPPEDSSLMDELEVIEPLSDDESEKEIPQAQPLNCKVVSLLSKSGNGAEDDSSPQSSFTANSQSNNPTMPTDNIQDNQQKSLNQYNQIARFNGSNNNQHNGARVSNHSKQYSNLHDHRQQNNH